MSKDILISLKNIYKNFSGVQVLEGINLDICQGDIIGIIGENGAGKSTLMKILSGIYQPSSGDIYLNKEKVVISNPMIARKLGISLVPQEFNLIKDLSVYNNIFLGSEIVGLLSLNKKAMQNRTKELLEELGVNVSPEERIENLSAAQKQMVEISKALAFKANILIMDEPTTMLTKYEIKILFNLINKLRSEGMTIIYISHKLKEIKYICNRVAVLRDGIMVADQLSKDLTTVEMAQKMVGRELSTIFPRKTNPSNSVMFEVKNLNIPDLVYDISFSLKKKEILGIAGLVGSGRTEIAESILGIRKKSSGIFLKEGKEIKIGTPLDALKHKISYLSEDRQGSGIITNFSVAKNITLTSLRSYSKRFFRRIDKASERRVVSNYIDSFKIKTDSQNKHLEYLSGGNQQKVSLAKSVDINPDILIVDEPTRGVDIAAKHEIYNFLNKLVEEKSISCILISSELEEIIGLCNRVLIMREGKVESILSDEELTEKNIMLAATGAYEEELF